MERNRRQQIPCSGQFVAYVLLGYLRYVRMSLGFSLASASEASSGYILAIKEYRPEMDSAHHALYDNARQTP